MKKAKLVIPTSVVMFLLLSAMLIMPIRAMTQLTSITPNSNPQMTFLAGKNGFQSDGVTIVVENESNTDLITVTSPAGLITTIDINKTETENIITVNGVKNSINQTIGSVPNKLTNQSLSSTIKPSLSLSINQTFRSTIGSSPLSINQTFPSTGASETPHSNNMLSMFSENYNSIDNYYPWDGLNFISGPGITYPHDDRGAYYIVPSGSWCMEGNQLEHFQMDEADSYGLTNVSPYLVDVGIGDQIAAFIATQVELGPLEIAALAVLIGSVFDFMVNSFDTSYICDEAGCVWFWLYNPFYSWLISNAANLASEAVYDWIGSFYQITRRFSF